MTRSLATVLATAGLVLVAACGSSADDAVLSLSPVAGSAMELIIPAFQGDTLIPSEYSCDGDNISPDVSRHPVPSGTKALAIIMDDPDASGFVHWLVYDIPASMSALPRAQPQTDTLSGGAKQGENSFGNIGYGGPCPPKGSEHLYRLRIFALDASTGLAPRERRYSTSGCNPSN